MPPEHEQTADAPNARIPTRSRRRAMDWSLVLASQDIPTAIENEPETGWALVVAASDLPRATESIRLYRLENARWSWRKPLLKEPFVFDWAAGVWVSLLGVFHFVSLATPQMRNAGVMDTTLVSSGQWWRLFTAIWLHADYAHLAANAGFGFLLLGLTMGLYGTGVGVLAAYLAGAGGNLADWIIFGGGHRSLGASGMVMGALGLLAIQSFVLHRELGGAKKYVFAGIAAGVMLFALLGLSPESDVVAHLGGFVCGMLAGVWLAFFRGVGRSLVANAIAAVLFAMLVIFPWWLAFTR